MLSFSDFRGAPWCAFCALAVNWSAGAVRASGWLPAGTCLTRGVSLGSGRGACRSLSIGTDFDCGVSPFFGLFVFGLISGHVFSMRGMCRKHMPEWDAYHKSCFKVQIDAFRSINFC